MSGKFWKAGVSSKQKVKHSACTSKFLEKTLQNKVVHFSKLSVFSRKYLIAMKDFSCVCGKFWVFFSIWVFFHKHSRFTGQQGKGETISLTPLYHFHPRHRHFDISREITVESSPLHITRSWTRTGNLCFPSTSR